jgi:hypothetical protein
LDYLEPIPHAVFCLLINIMSYAQYRWVSKEITENAIMPKCLWILTNTSPITKICMERNRLHLGYSKVSAFLAKTEQNELWLFNLKYNIDKKILRLPMPDL